MAKFSLEQLNFFKFSSVVLDEFPIALRQVFVNMWDNQVAPTPGFQKWDDSPLVRNMFLSKEGGKTKYVPTGKSYHEWDCTALFEATLYAQSFAIPDGSGGLSTLNKLYVKPRHLPSGTFHPVISIPGNEAETFALALDQLRLLRNALCHQTSTQKIDKTTFDYYLKLAREAFVTLKQDTTRIDEIGKLEEEDFPTARLQKLETELKKEKDIDVKFKQINDHLNQIDCQIKTVRSDVKTAVTDVQTKVEEVRSDVKTTVTDVQTKVEEVKTAAAEVERKLENVESEVKIATSELAKVTANVDDVKQAVQSGIKKDLFVPDSSIPDELPNFVGRDKECKAVEHHLTDEFTRLVNVWGPPGFGKTSVAIRVAHHLQEKNFPVYFASVRGMKSMADLVSKLLSIFVDDKQVSRISSSDLVIQCLQQIRNPFVLILDNADDLLESEDAKRKQRVLRFIEEIITHCKEIKLLLTTRESLDYLSHKLSIYLEKINVLDGISSAHLVRLLLPDALEDDCKCVVRECGNVPMSMRLMCSIIKEANISINALLQELSDSTIVEVLNSESFPDDFRLKSVINTSFKRLMISERNAFVSLSVFPGWFGIEEAQAILKVKSEVKTKQVIRSLERKSLIHCGHSFSRFTLHSLLRSFIKDKVKNDEAVEAVFIDAQVQFYDHYISRCEIANKNFLTGSYSEAFRSFLDRRECIISSLSNGPGKDMTYSKAVGLLSEAKSFLYVALHGKKKLFERLYDIAIEEAKRRKKVGDKKMLLSAKEFPLRKYQPYTAHSFYWLGLVQHDMGDLKGALDSLQRAANIGSNLHGDHKDTASSYCWLGVVQHGMGDLKGALDSLQRGANIRSNLLGDHKDTASSYYWLGKVQRDMGDLKGALDSLQRAANIRSNLHGDHKDTASSYHFLGLVQRDMGDLKEAMDSFQRAANMESNLLGDHEDTACSFHSLGLMQHDMGDLKGALDSLQRAANIRSNLLGDHKDTASSYDWLGKVQRDLGDLKGALDSLQRAANIRSNLRGDHKDTASSYCWLGLVQHDMGDLKGALDSLQRAANIRSNLHGDHKDTASTYDWLGKVQRDMGDLKGALDSLQRAANIRSSVLGDHKDTASSFFELSLVQKKAGDLKSALESVQVSLQMTKELLGDHLNTADSFYEQGFIHFAMGDFNSAVESLQKAADMNFNLRRDHINTARSYHSLGLAQVKIQDCEGALDSLQKAIQIKSNLLGDHEDTASSYHILGFVQRDMGDLEGALDCLQKAANMRSNLLGDHKDTARSYHELGVVQHGMGDLKGALESLKKALDMRTNVLGDHRDTTSSLNELRAVRKKLT